MITVTFNFVDDDVEPKFQKHIGGTDPITETEVLAGYCIAELVAEYFTKDVPVNRRKIMIRAKQHIDRMVAEANERKRAGAIKTAGETCPENN